MRLIACSADHGQRHGFVCSDSREGNKRNGAKILRAAERKIEPLRPN
jgi:hypothetical protein